MFVDARPDNDLGYEEAAPDGDKYGYGGKEALLLQLLQGSGLSPSIFSF